MNAEPLLAKIASGLAATCLEAVMVGNAAAALRGAPVTTLDIDFMFRKTRANMEKLKRLADNLQATILKPYYPASGLYRIVRDDEGLQLDFMFLITRNSFFRESTCTGGKSVVRQARTLGGQLA